jgi:hypothetical protein
MLDSREKRMGEIQDAIRRIFLHDWDPNDVAGIGPDDEYDSYIAPIYQILAGSRSEQELIGFLSRSERDFIGITYKSPEELRPLALKLLALNVKL